MWYIHAYCLCSTDNFYISVANATYRKPPLPSNELHILNWEKPKESMMCAMGPTEVYVPGL